MLESDLLERMSVQEFRRHIALDELEYEEQVQQMRRQQFRAKAHGPNFGPSVSRGAKAS